MKTIYLAIAALIAITLVGSMLGSSHSGAVHIIAPVVGSIITSFLFVLFLKWEDRMTEAD
ncbi:hypothetical protein [Alteribacillus iranensis]|uniref:Uncharacterized protein n=1 Tax=Alteribacillus iranensis TaxID=930128 RepID=A0A1I2BXI6_9BACI|nr:hypothetical protein [Alteribacillus iranensis]SFE60817.1 hypothetical protein SAMN05192532_102565 [Alteribacillus iranensis]